MPPPLPIGLYVIFTPLAASYFCCQAATNGAGKVAPAPFNSSAPERACAPETLTAPIAEAATSRTETAPASRFLRVTKALMASLEVFFIDSTAQLSSRMRLGARSHR